MSSVKCLSCDMPIQIDFKPYKGDFIECEQCGMEFEISSTTPLKITWAEFEDDMEFDEDDDLDDFDDEDEEEDEEEDY